MGYSAEVMQRARARLAAAKADRESENRQHLDEAYSRVPRLREIDRQLRLTMAMAAQAVFASGGDVNEALEEAKNKNLTLQREREVLVNMYFEEGFLDDSPICDVCGGSGYVGANMCECLGELCRQEQKKELTFLNVGKEAFDQFRLDYYPDRVDPKWGVNIRTVMDKTYQTCRKYALGFSEKSGNLLFSGDTVMADGYGRCDLYSADPTKMNYTLNRLSNLAASEPKLMIYPGHGEAAYLSTAINKIYNKE